MHPRLVIVFCKLLQNLLRLFTKSSGTALPGYIAEKLSKNITTYYAQQLNNNLILVTGTNGKTTSVRTISTVLRKAGLSVITNSSGSNFTRGILGSLIEASAWNGALHTRHKPVGVFEVDEAFIERVAKDFSPNTIVVLNIFRDQLDRFGELDTVAYLIGQALTYANNVVLNADDPLVWALQKYCDEKTRIIGFGASRELQKMYDTDDGLYKSTRQLTDATPEIMLTNVQQKTFGSDIKVKVSSESFAIRTKLPGIHNAINITASTATLVAEDLTKEQFSSAIEAFSEVEPPFGRGEIIDFGTDRTLQITLVKNPAGMNQIVNSFLQANSYSCVLFVLNDNYADGRDVSWIWDAKLESANLSHAKLLVGGSRSHDMAIRFHYLDLKPGVVENAFTAVRELDRVLKEKESALIVSTYTGMLEFRDQLIKAGYQLARIHEDA